MAVTANVYGLALQSMLNKEVDWDTDSVKAMLCTAAYVPDQDTHRYKNSVTNEVTGTGYTAGGIVVPTRGFTYDGAANNLRLTCGNLAFGTLTVAGIRIVVFYVDTGTATTSPLLSWMDLGADQSPTASPFTIDMSNGVMVLNAA